ncbi:Gfo/Idh/MocA family protein [Stratiformator vulcanicus]|uniref:Gfo/Idh/MocA family protein n=1 Tax=Stratiformator vulcanicus TaxID=2527980 RepID=UPI0028780F13|nr:Gfo/Idh/MocA family oxidoreductase [Stratiformator vulcanicus]
MLTPWPLRRAVSDDFRSPNERPVVGCIGTGSRWGFREDGMFKGVGSFAMEFGDVAAVSDVDANRMNAAALKVRDLQAEAGRPSDVAKEADYRKVLDRDDIDLVTIVTPDHWHTKIAIEALRAGKDVYCEKPLTLTIEESKQIRKAVEETGRVFQVGTQQRTESSQGFLKAIAMVRDGRLGKIHSIKIGINGAPVSDSIPKVDVPDGLHWERWLGQAPLVDYRWSPKTRDAKQYWNYTNCHYDFRWWYAYSGGKMTDWGAHHVDIAQWLINQNGDGQGPTRIEPVVANHPVPLNERGEPTDPTRYNTADRFVVHVDFPNDTQFRIGSEFRNGLLVEGTKGRIFVNRGALEGSPVEDMKSNPLPDGAVEAVYGGEPTTHMANFMQCVKSRKTPISDVASHVRAINTCHLGNIALRLNRTVKWDAAREEIIGDELARNMQGREQRKGYETDA